MHESLPGSAQNDVRLPTERLYTVLRYVMQDVGYLTNTFEGSEHEGVGRHGPELLEEDAQGDTGMSEHAKQR